MLASDLMLQADELWLYEISSQGAVSCKQISLCVTSLQVNDLQVNLKVAAGLCTKRGMSKEPPLTWSYE